MTWTYTEEYYKNYTRDTWNESAAKYAAVARNLDKWTTPLLARAAPRMDECVLDVASGLGDPALLIAPLVMPEGRVTGIDLSSRMVELARERAKRLGVANVDFEVMDAEALTFPDATFDLVTNRFGLQIITDPGKAIAETRRVLKPGGRFAATVWGPGERAPAIHFVIGPMLEYAEPDEAGYIPTPYEMGGPGELAALLADAGLRDAREERHTYSWDFASPEAALTGVLEGTPIGHSLSEEDATVQREVLAKARANLATWTRKDGTVSMPAEAVVVTAKR